MNEIKVDFLLYPAADAGWCGHCGEGWAFAAGVHCVECSAPHSRVGFAKYSEADPSPVARLRSADPSARRRALRHQKRAP